MFRTCCWPAPVFCETKATVSVKKVNRFLRLVARLEDARPPAVVWVQGQPRGPRTDHGGRGGDGVYPRRDDPRPERESSGCSVTAGRGLRTDRLAGFEVGFGLDVAGVAVPFRLGVLAGFFALATGRRARRAAGGCSPPAISMPKIPTK